MIESQKQGLLHEQQLMIEHRVNAYIKAPKNLDKFSSAEMHKDRTDLYDKVVKHMLESLWITESKKHLLQQRRVCVNVYEMVVAIFSCVQR